MLFHTWTFALFFVVVYSVYLAVKRTWLRLPWLLCASYVFYGWWDPRYLILIVYATAVDFTVVLLMSRTRRRWLRRLLLAASVLNSLALLGQFKYARFMVDSLNALFGWLGLGYTVAAPQVIWPPGADLLIGWINVLLGWMGIEQTMSPLSLLLPVGISFYVFQSMSYTIDYYRGAVSEELNFVHYATFVSLFPQLVAGPIERAKNLLPQLGRAPRVTGQDVSDGLSMFVVGLFKKVALADYLALYVDKVYDAPAEYGAPALLLATFAFSWQIYFDFSGYTDMARGVARMMGIRLMLNFNNPYLATGLGDFWRRWHISLSTWFRDYVYVPLGGNRRGQVRTYANMCLTMLVSGLWHGASWTFVVWGAVHALGRVLTRRMESGAFYRRRVPVLVKRAWVFCFVTFAWIFFRAGSFADARTILARMATTAWDDPRFPIVAMALVLSVWAYQLLYESRLRRLLKPSAVRIAIVVFMVLYMAVFVTSDNKPFIYFQF